MARTSGTHDAPDTPDEIAGGPTTSAYPAPPTGQTDPSHPDADTATGLTEETTRAADNVDPATLDDENYADLDLPPGSTRVIALPRKTDGSLNLFGMDVEVTEEVADYGDVVKARVQGDPAAMARLAMRSRNFYAKNWNQHLHASGDVTSS